MFEPQLFITTGETSAMYTLREDYEHFNADGTVDIWSFHHRNLSTDYDKAVVKAKEFAEHYAMPLRANSESEMREITRRTSEEVQAEREAEQIAVDARKAEWKAKIEKEQDELIAEGKIPFGKFKGWLIKECPFGYASWLADSVADFEDGSVIKNFAELIISDHKDRILPKPVKKKITGEVGERLEFTATVTRQNSFDGMYGTTFFTTLVTKDRVCLIVKSGSFYPEVGEKLKFKATVKSHDDYKGQAQTVIQRVKVQ